MAKPARKLPLGGRLDDVSEDGGAQKVQHFFFLPNLPSPKLAMAGRLVSSTFSKSVSLTNLAR